MNRRDTVIINSTLVISMLLCPALFSQTPTPTPDPCSGCPSPTSIGCMVNYPACLACWENCGQPIATPTPTPTATPQPTPTPVGPECVLHMIGPGRVFLVAVWIHESKDPLVRYTYTVHPKDVLPGSWRGDPSDVEGEPVGYEWWDAISGELLKSCGDTDRRFYIIFKDGFETGDISKW